MTAIGAEVTRLDGCLRWFQRLQERQGPFEQAQKAHEAAQAAQTAAEPRRQSLLRSIEIERASRPLHAAEAQAIQRRDASHAAYQQKATALAAARARLPEARRAVELAQARWTESKDAQRQALPKLERARSLDAQLGPLTQHWAGSF